MHFYLTKFAMETKPELIRYNDTKTSYTSATHETTFTPACLLNYLKT